MLQEFYASHNNGRKLSEKALQSMGFYDKDGMLANGAVLLQMIIREKRRRCSVLSFPVLIKAVNVSLLLIVSMEISLRCSII